MLAHNLAAFSIDMLLYLSWVSVFITGFWIKAVSVKNRVAEGQVYIRVLGFSHVTNAPSICHQWLIIVEIESITNTHAHIHIYIHWVTTAQHLTYLYCLCSLQVGTKRTETEGVVCETRSRKSVHIKGSSGPVDHERAEVGSVETGLVLEG